uniref:Taste receptor type 2 n=1 Tax=Cavia porcellus TaxID=10141 RepID=H0W4D7_CAVPO
LHGSFTLLGFIVCFLIIVMHFLPGVLVNGFIVVVNMVDFVKQRQMAPLDLLLSCLAISRITLHMLIFLVYLVLHCFKKESVLVTLNVIFMFVHVWKIWLATWLGVFYCAKITTIPYSLCFWLKRRISKLVPWLILGSTLYASISAGIYEKHAWIMSQKYLGNFFTTNVTQTKGIGIGPLYILIFHLTVPLIIFLIAVLLLIFSLGRHIQQVTTLTMGTTDTYRGTPMRALLSILSFLILYFSHYIMVILIFFQLFQSRSLFFEFCTLMAGIYPSIHSVILILGNPKLKQNAKKFLLCGQCGQ